MIYQKEHYTLEPYTSILGFESSYQHSHSTNINWSATMPFTVLGTGDSADKLPLGKQQTAFVKLIF